MSQPSYNPYAAGNQNSAQGQYGLSGIQAERDVRRATSNLAPGSSFSVSASSVIPENSGGMLPSLMSQSMNYRPEESRAIMDEDIERSIDMHISRAREEVRLLSKPMLQPKDQGTHFTGARRDDFRSSGTGMAPYPMSSTSASRRPRHSDVESGNSSLDWLSDYKRSNADDSKIYSLSFLSNYASSGDGRLNAPSERDHNHIPGLGDYDYTVPDKPAAPQEYSRTKYTSESAANILLHFGLEKEDLELLISYPEDQLTPANLPYILRQIRIQKAKRDTTVVQPLPYSEPQPSRNMSGLDSHSFSSGGVGTRHKELSSAILQPSKVIEYGHTGKYTGGVGQDIGRSSGTKSSSTMLLMDSSSRHSQGQLHKSTAEVKSFALDSSREQVRAVTSLSSALSSVASPSNDQTKHLQSQPNHPSSTVPSSFSLPKKDTDIRVVQSVLSKPIPLQEPQADHQSKSKTQRPSTLLRGVHPSRPGLVVIDSESSSGTKIQSNTQGQGSAAADQLKKKQAQQQPVQQMQQQLKQQRQTVSQTGQVMWPPVVLAAKSVPPVTLVPGITNAAQVMGDSVLIPGVPRPVLIPPALPQSLPSLANLNLPMQLTSNRQLPAQVEVSKGLPTPAMMHDYAAASPRIFPHTCSLCYKECTDMKVSGSSVFSLPSGNFEM